MSKVTRLGSDPQASVLKCQSRYFGNVFCVFLHGIAPILSQSMNTKVTKLILVRLDSEEVFLFTGGTGNGCQISG